MILVDSPIWVDYLRSGNARLASLLDAGQVLGHPFVVGELALGNLQQRELILADLQVLPQAVVADHPEVLLFIHQHALHGAGIGYIDAHLLASVRLTAGGLLWTRDKRLHAIAERLDLASN